MMIQWSINGLKSSISIWISISNCAGCRNWSSHHWAVATLTSLCHSLQKLTEMTTSLVLQSGTTSTEMERRPDTPLDGALTPLVSLLPFFHVNCCTRLKTWARVRSFPWGCCLTQGLAPGPSLNNHTPNPTPTHTSWSKKMPALFPIFLVSYLATQRCLSSTYLYLCTYFPLFFFLLWSKAQLCLCWCLNWLITFVLFCFWFVY